MVGILGRAVGIKCLHRDKRARIIRVGHHTHHYMRIIRAGVGTHPKRQLQAGKWQQVGVGKRHNGILVAVGACCRVRVEVHRVGATVGIGRIIIDHGIAAIRRADPDVMVPPARRQIVHFHLSGGRTRHTVEILCVGHRNNIIARCAERDMAAARIVRSAAGINRDRIIRVGHQTGERHRGVVGYLDLCTVLRKPRKPVQHRPAVGVTRLNPAHVSTAGRDMIHPHMLHWGTGRHGLDGYVVNINIIVARSRLRSLDGNVAVRSRVVGKKN